MSQILSPHCLFFFFLQLLCSQLLKPCLAQKKKKKKKKKKKILWQIAYPSRFGEEFVFGFTKMVRDNDLSSFSQINSTFYDI
ncbi:hypothetical protein P175DRAFT_0260693 [Aspergillus ochraceoroseus IBT 24754]|uniref:Secreted protein n=1 Tax=Aspergillus ochraceoroseus IBT 24754 TaxID=1392256 RepID=A0A2T5LUH8_9EURO|nr:uncharacterized protein P175DRAFT_0260693 [Aspergillus ochraceoroseus IBT 24754]PTU19941.1 hypothetical protein P175DRAFT_0260693 [Aspergillus ochraceoroseus IBT 24754]